ncbi:hypothetical protein N2152v2_009199 [Parachlorella kessleri]
MDGNYAGLPGGASAQQVPGMAGMGVPPNYAMPASYMQQFAAAQAQTEQLRRFWVEMKEEAGRAGTDPLEFKNQQLPLARIKKIMKSDEDVRMISAEAPVLFAKACEYFILELTLRAWGAAEETKRRTLQRSDIATAIARTDIFDFLVDTVPREEANPPPASGPAIGAMPGQQGMGMYNPGAMQQQYMPGMMPGAGGMGSASGPGGAAASSMAMQLPNGAVGAPGGLHNAPGNMGMAGGGAMGMYGANPLGFSMPPNMYMAQQQQQAQQAGMAAALQQQQQQQAQQAAKQAAVDGAGGGGRP